ncbi:DUF2339 domain-containing protein [Amycolatopsis sp. cg5]|uniref:DUF2339 domain-containing protein n=1 Tax=Amycolatopsis sp. cg5 TaxID=3238802 RepID=UPI0035241569
MPTDRETLLRLAGEIDDLGRRLSLVGAELRTVQSDQVEQAPEPQPQAPQPMPYGYPAMPAYGPPMMPPPSYQVPPQQQQWQPAHPPLASMQYLPPPAVPRPSLVEKLGKEGAGSRVLAWVGGAVTLLGVVLLLVLAIQRGWLGPMPRVLVGGAFGLGMIGTGVWLHRNPAGRTGAFALAATGIAVLYLDAIAATTLYEFLPRLAGLGVGLVVAIGGLLLAARWNSALLGTAVVIGCAVCAPVLTKGFHPELVAFLLMLQLATAPVQLRRDWTALAIGAGVPPLLASLLSTTLLGDPGSTANTAAALGSTVVGIALALFVAMKRENDAAALTLLACSVVPSLAAAAFLPKAQAVAVAGATAVVLLAIWATRRVWTGFAGDVAGIAGMVAALQATSTQFDGTARATILLGEGVVLALVAWRGKSKVALWGSFGFGLIGAIVAMFGDFRLTTLIVFWTRQPGELAGALLTAALIMVISGALPWVAYKLGALRTPSQNVVPWVFAGLGVLTGAAGVVLNLALLVMPDRTGFTVGHAVITVSWTVAALVLLMRGIDSVVLRVIGLVLVGAAVLKLVLFDLGALDGMARVGAFLCAGLILLAAGTRYARMVASR